MIDDKIRIPCPSCQVTLAIAAHLLPQNKSATVLTCPKCKHVFTFNIPLRGEKRNPAFDQDDEPRTQGMDSGDLIVGASLWCEGLEKEFILQKGENWVGREVGVEIPITTDAFLSRRHCCVTMKIKNDSIEVMLSDKNSKNGTFLNEKRLSEYDSLYLAEGDNIKAGRTFFTLKLKKSNK